METVLCNNGTRDVANGIVSPCSYSGGVATKQNPETPLGEYKDVGICKNGMMRTGTGLFIPCKKIEPAKASFLEGNPKLIMMVLIGIGIYIGYKKFIK